MRKIVCIAILFLCIECNNGNQKESNNLKNDTVAYIDPDSFLKTKIKPELIDDSTKLVKAFDDIYFGSVNLKSYQDKQYSINSSVFYFCESYRKEKFGLYEFNLEEFRAYSDLENLSSLLNDLENTISVKYGNSKNVSIVQEDEILKVTKQLMGKEFKLPPDDEKNRIFLKDWQSSNILIQLGYIIHYDPDYDAAVSKGSAESHNISEFKKQFSSIIHFEYLPISKKLKEEENESKKKQFEADTKKF